MTSRRYCDSTVWRHLKSLIVYKKENCLLQKEKISERIKDVYDILCRVHSIEVLS